MYHALVIVAITGAQKGGGGCQYVTGLAGVAMVTGIKITRINTKK